MAIINKVDSASEEAVQTVESNIQAVNPKSITGKRVLVVEDEPTLTHGEIELGYGEEQLKDLEATIEHAACDTVVIGTPIDLSRVVSIPKPSTRVHYDLQERTHPALKDTLKDFIQKS